MGDITAIHVTQLRGDPIRRYCTTAPRSTASVGGWAMAGSRNAIQYLSSPSAA